MAVTTTWAAGHSTVPPPQLRPSSSSSSSSSSIETMNQLFKNKFPYKLFLRRGKNHKLSCYCCNNSEDNRKHVDFDGISSVCHSSESSCSSSSDWDWSRWSRHFSDIEQTENFASILKFQLEEAIEKEDFEEAAKLKISISETTSNDSIAEIMSQLKYAINEERYHDASKLCRDTGHGLVGWWVGYSKDKDDPFGRLIRITPGMGRFIAKCYSPRQLVTSSSGTPLFEIFVVKDANWTYKMQVVFLQQIKRNLKSSNSSSDKSAKVPSAGENQNAPLVDVKNEEDDPEKGKGKSISLEGAAEEGIKSVINFLIEKIPELKVKVMRVDITEDMTEDAVKQFIEENDESMSESSDEEATELDNDQQAGVAAQRDGDTMEDESNIDMKLYIGGILHNKDDSPSKEEYVRVPANVEDMGKDSFVLRIPTGSQDNEDEEKNAAKAKVASIAALGVSELMPPEVAKAFWNSGKVSRKVSRDVRELVKLAVSQAQKRSRLSEYTDFSRITTSNGNLDPFDGLYVGAFGPYGTEIVQLRRKYGNWTMNDEDKYSGVEFFEYVEAVKLTGDLNVPAGQVTFRAKVGKVNRLANRGAYPHELGVVASYKGQGRIADFGFKNPKWVEGELLQLNGKGLGPFIKGADLGFLYVVPEQSFLVLFTRLILPE